MLNNMVTPIFMDAAIFFADSVRKMWQFKSKVTGNVVNYPKITGKINNYFFSGKKWKNVNLLQPIYRKIYRYTPIYQTPIYRYINISIYITRNISIFPIYRYIGAIPNSQVANVALTERNKIIPSGGLQRKGNSTVGGKPHNHNVATRAWRY